MIWLIIVIALWLVLRFGRPLPRRYLLNLIIVVFDILPNVLLGGSPYNTMSERAWNHRANKWGRKAVVFVDILFLVLAGERDHCRNADEGPDEEQYAVLK